MTIRQVPDSPSVLKAPRDFGCFGIPFQIPFLTTQSYTIILVAGSESIEQKEI